MVFSFFNILSSELLKSPTIFIYWVNKHWCWTYCRIRNGAVLQKKGDHTMCCVLIIQYVAYLMTWQIYSELIISV